MSASPPVRGPGRADRRRPSLPTIATRAVVDDRIFARGDRVLCAVSGGPDSMALLHVLAHLRARLGHTLVACGVDHGLRAEAGAELERGAELAASLDVPFEIVKLDVGAGSNLQARARAARHGALRDVAARTGATVIATGHTADDRAETVLSRLLRGAGPRGLAVLPPREGPLVRPLVRALRSDVAAYLRRHGIAAASDPSNLDPRFQRVRIRTELLPLLQTLAPRIVQSLCDLADRLGDTRAEPDPLAGLNAAQRRAVARARAQGRPRMSLLLRGGRTVDVLLNGRTGDDRGDVQDQNAAETAPDPAGGALPSRSETPHVFSQKAAFPEQTAVLIQERSPASSPRRRRRPPP